MEKESNSRIICSNCQLEIEKNYCAECGQYYTSERLSAYVVFSDFIDTFFALERSYFLNVKQLLLHPRFVVENYWNGYRKFYFSPSRMLVITTLFLAIFLYFNENTFLGAEIETSISWLGTEFFIAILVLFFFTLSSMVTFIKKKKNLFEHFVLNTYIFSIVIPAMLIFSIIFEAIGIANYLQMFFILFYSIWITKVFENKWWRILMMSILNLFVFATMLLLLTVIFVVIKGSVAHLID